MIIRLVETEFVPRGRKEGQADRHKATNSHFSLFCERN